MMTVEVKDRTQFGMADIIKNARADDDASVPAAAPSEAVWLRKSCRKELYCGQPEGHSGPCDDIPF